MTDPAYIVHIPLEVVNATWPGGYYELYLKFRGEGMNGVDAWSRVESELASYGLPGRFSSYDSFRSRLSAMRPILKAWRKRMSQPITL